MPLPKSLASKVAAARKLKGLPSNSIMTNLHKRDEKPLKPNIIGRYGRALKDFYRYFAHRISHTSLLILTSFLEFENLPLKYHPDSDEFEPAPIDILKRFVAFYTEAGEGRLVEVKCARSVKQKISMLISIISLKKGYVCFSDKVISDV